MCLFAAADGRENVRGYTALNSVTVVTNELDYFKV
jgi:hypothetical protein